MFDFLIPVGLELQEVEDYVMVHPRGGNFHGRLVRYITKWTGGYWHHSGWEIIFRFELQLLEDEAGLENLRLVNSGALLVLEQLRDMVQIQLLTRACFSLSTV